MLIYKNILPVDTMDILTLDLPFNSAVEAARHVFKVDNQSHVPCMWYQADLNGEDGGKKNEFAIIAIGTGHLWPNSLTKDHYIGTLLLYGGSLVLHYFLVEKEYLNRLLGDWEQDDEI